jgi:hypothetical protein
LRKLLEKSNSRFAPLVDPLLIDFDLHRWLVEEREEVYSDWLEWVVKQLPTPHDVFYVFGMQRLEDTAKTFSTEREKWVKPPHSESYKRLDLVIRCQDCLLVIEVKKSSPEDADVAKQGEYVDWGEAEPEPNKYFVLLANEGDRPEYHQFRLWTYRDLCLRLREKVERLIQNQQLSVTAAALILSYVGALEQNMLSFSSTAARSAFKGQIVRTARELAAYLGPHLKEGINMDKEANFAVFQEGLKSYAVALSAIRELCGEVYSKSRSVLEANVEDLRQTLQREIQPVWITPKVWPNCIDPTDWDGRDAWAMAVADARDLCDIYAGLYWQVKDGDEPTPGVCVGLTFKRIQLFLATWEHLRRVAGDRIQSYRPTRELWIWEPIDPKDAAEFGDRLDTIMKEWITLLRQIPPEVFTQPPQTA